MKWMLSLAVLGLGALLLALPASGQAGDDMKPGLIAEIWSFGDTAVEDFPTIPADKKPNIKRIDKDINVDVGDDKWPGTDYADHFFIRWTGTVTVEKDGKVTFFTESDDGSRLFIDGKQVVDNNGLHAADEKSGDVELKAGPHEIKVEFFENDGQASCKVSWQPAGKEKQIIPAAALSHKKAAEEGLTAK